MVVNKILPLKMFKIFYMFISYTDSFLMFYDLPREHKWIKDLRHGTAICEKCSQKIFWSQWWEPGEPPTPVRGWVDANYKNINNCAEEIMHNALK